MMCFKLIKKLFFALLLAISFNNYAFQYETGDLIFQRSASSQSLAIALITQSHYTHMGVIIMKQDKPYVFEAISTVRYTPLEQWIKRGINRHHVIKRLILPLDARQKKALIKAAGKYENKRYDIHFEWSDDKIYCSELAWKMYDGALGIKIGKLQAIKDFDLSHPSVQQKIKEYYKNKAIPLEETVITPISMFNSPLLVTVREN